MQHVTSQTYIGKPLEETLQVGCQWPNEQITFAARCTVCRLQIADVTPVLDVLLFVSASFMTLHTPGRKTYYAAQVLTPMASLRMFLVEVLQQHNEHNKCTY